jgi:hypothetical protein
MCDCDSVEVLAQQASVLAVQGVEQFKLGKDGPHAWD